MGSIITTSKGKVLITGGSGFIASHILDSFLGDGFNVVVTVRSEAKGHRIVESVEPHVRQNVSYAVVDDIAKPGAFDNVLRSEPFDYVVHTASPCHFDVQDPIKDFLEPAIKGTTGILESIKLYAPTVKRVVITSSAAAIVNPPNYADVYDETHWAPTTWEDAVDNHALAYKASKVLSEKAAWAYIESEKPSFDLAVINCTWVFGPVQRNLSNLDSINISNERVRNLLWGRHKDSLPPSGPAWTFVDVRDVALAHLRAATVPAAGNNRFFIVGGLFSNKRLTDIIRKGHPELEAILPPKDSPDDMPEKMFQFDNSKSRNILGIEYMSLEKSVLDTVDSILPYKECS